MGRAAGWIGALSSYLIRAWGHGVMGRVHGRMCGWWQPCGIDRGMGPRGGEGVCGWWQPCGKNAKTPRRCGTMGARRSRAWGPWNGAGGAGGGGGESGHGKGAWGDGVGRAGRAERAGMYWGPFKSSDRGMGPRGHGKGAWRGRVCGWWQPCETWGHELEP